MKPPRSRGAKRKSRKPRRFGHLTTEVFSSYILSTDY
jgi:hypothetical protein